MVTRDPRATAMTEAELMEHIRALVDGLGLFAHHGHDGRRSWGPGFPDLVIVGRGGVLWRECKTEHGSLAPEQRQWGDTLKRAGENWRVWRPSDWLSGQIARELTEVAAVQAELFSA
jgi:hypothetical protein